MANTDGVVSLGRGFFVVRGHRDYDRGVLRRNIRWHIHGKHGDISLFVVELWLYLIEQGLGSGIQILARYPLSFVQDGLVHQQVLFGSDRDGLPRRRLQCNMEMIMVPPCSSRIYIKRFQDAMHILIWVPIISADQDMGDQPAVFCAIPEQGLACPLVHNRQIIPVPGTVADVVAAGEGVQRQRALKGSE